MLPLPEKAILTNRWQWICPLCACAMDGEGEAAYTDCCASHMAKCISLDNMPDTFNSTDNRYNILVICMHYGYKLIHNVLEAQCFMLAEHSNCI